MLEPIDSQKRCYASANLRCNTYKWKGEGFTFVRFCHPDTMHVKEKRQLVLVTTVDIGGGLTDQIELYLGDRPEVRACSPA